MVQPATTTSASDRSLIDQAFTRASGAERIEGNRVRLLRDAAEHYPAWRDAIASAERYVYFESYIIRDDDSGKLLADALKARARDGVKVRVTYDWLGGLGKTSRRYLRDLREAGVEVRCFNPFRFTRPLGWVRRNHRKSLVVDGTTASITGLCVGDEWVGDPARGIPPWRDTGIEVEGPAVTPIERAFADIWALVGPPIPAGERRADPVPLAGDIPMRVVASEPHRAGLLLLDQLIASAARETLWLTDAYYSGLPSYVQALRSAALDGVDVRLLLPGATDLPVVRMIGRTGYPALLEAGVRIFEWNGPMIHAKTAVADGRWSRVGSSNLNIASWLANYELDAVIEDAGFAETMMDQYETDLANSTEVVLGVGRQRRQEKSNRGRGSAGRAALVSIRLGNTLSAAVTSRRSVAVREAGIVALAGGLAILAGIIAALWPRLIAIPFAIAIAWIGVGLLVRAYGMRGPMRPAAGKETPTQKRNLSG
ncbi:MAG TPA: phospholipase D-like domain-containing protein [Gemmatimonadota bacterium]|nr:phospholipase D-like domain-containing protein [Gemmatimonadota bacterium]